MKITIVLDVPDGTTVADITASPTTRSAPQPPEVMAASTPPAEPEWGGIADEPRQEFPPIPAGPSMSVRDLLSRLEKVDKVPAAAGWAKKHFGTGSFKNLTDEQRGAVAVAFHV